MQTITRIQKPVKWSELITLQEAWPILKQCFEQIRKQEGQNFRYCLPAGSCRTFLESMVQYDGKWVIFYNNKEGSTKTAAVPIA